MKISVEMQGTGWSLLPPEKFKRGAAVGLQQGFKGCALFGRDAGRDGSAYVQDAMIHALDIDPRIARRCLHAGCLQAGA